MFRLPFLYLTAVPKTCGSVRATLSRLGEVRPCLVAKRQWTDVLSEMDKQNAVNDAARLFFNLAFARLNMQGAG